MSTEQNKRKIVNAEDFGVSFNCLTRRYLWDFDGEYLDLILRVMDRYLLYFSQRTLICSIRDFAEGADNIRHSNHPGLLEDQQERYERVLKNLVQRYLDIKLADCASDLHKQQVIRSLYEEGDFNCRTRHPEPWRFPAFEAFEYWVLDNQLDKGGRIPWEQTDTLPFEASFREDFLMLCIACLQYSYGRYTYTPEACRDFIRDNFGLITDAGIRKIDGEVVKALSERPMPDDSRGKEETAGWQEYRRKLQMELLTREWCRKTWKLICSEGGIQGAVKDISDEDKLLSETDCALAEAKLEGINRWLNSGKCRMRERDRYLELVLAARNRVRLASEQLWLKEYGDQYIKVGPHTYIRPKERG